MRHFVFDMVRFRADLTSLLNKHMVDVDNETLSRCEAHMAVLVKWNRVMNLVGDLSPESAVSRHYGESLFLASLLPNDVESLADIGSGGGFPGVGVAALRRNCRVTLVESRQKKAAFLRESTRDWFNCGVFAGLGADLTGEVRFVASRGVDPESVLSIASVRGSGVALLLSADDAFAVLHRITDAGYEGAVHRVPWRASSAVLLGFPGR